MAQQTGFSTYRIWLFGAWAVGFGVAASIDVTQQEWLKAAFHGSMLLVGWCYYHYTKDNYTPEHHGSLLSELSFGPEYCQFGVHSYHRHELVHIESGLLDQRKAFLQIQSDGRDKVQIIFPVDELPAVRQQLRANLPAELQSEADFHLL